MITVTGRLVARVVMVLSGAALVALGAVSYLSNRVTGRDVLAAAAALLVGAVAALWLRRDRRNGGRQQ